MLNSPYLIIPVILIGSIVIGTLFHSFLHRIRKGLFTILPNSNTNIQSFQTNHAIVNIYNTEKKVYITPRKKDQIALHVDEIIGLEMRFEEKTSWYEILFDLQLTDLFKSNRDTVDWYYIYLQTSNQEKILLFSAGQYQRREFLMNFLINFSNNLLARFNLYRDLDSYKEDVITNIKDMFSKIDKEIHVDYSRQVNY
ncbi:hypothetical protein [Candidatus Uabimicrobium sp. HlEnr_7]|uniref:hypothetical protein n=1 Tax=Candidatus Uabimicrobium helgolandensis TaxID=3095367 RepID=UPI0035561CA6